MDWKIALLVVAVVGVMFAFKRRSLVSASNARKYLEQGALVVDVRTPGEFQAGHLDKAKNLPLDDLRSVLPGRVPDKSQVLLLHCLSGNRSGMAKGQLKRMGYTNVHNLGSFGRAQRLLAASRS